jgi:hypothetical protein
VTNEPPATRCETPELSLSCDGLSCLSRPRDQIDQIDRGPERPVPRHAPRWFLRPFSFYTQNAEPTNTAIKAMSLAAVDSKPIAINPALSRLKTGVRNANERIPRNHVTVSSDIMDECARCRQAPRNGSITSSDTIGSCDICFCKFGDGR